MKKMLLLMTVVICALGVNAQNTRVITGAVIDKNGNPLPNALVEATGGAESVTTDADGSFRIEVPVWLKSLTAKYAGFPEKKIKLNNQDQVLFEMKPKTGSWFLNFAPSTNITGDGHIYECLGFMGGYLGNWGGYAKLTVPSIGGCIGSNTPSFSAGAIKQISKPLYLYFGIGYSAVMGERHDGSYVFAYAEDGLMVEGGVIFKINRVDFSIGYGYADSFCCFVNPAVIQLSVGYCFK